MPRLTSSAAPALLALVASACVASDTSTRPGPPPRRRLEGARDPGFSGADPSSRGWVRVDDLLWVESAHADAFRRGYLWDGSRYVTVAESDATATSPGDGYALRTDHLRVSTNVAFERARALAAVGERHVRALVALLGDPLDLRLPADPIPVVVAARRDEFARLLGAGGGDAPSWGAFYRAADGTVVACDEPARTGALPLAADLRHELTHAVVDLGREDAGREAMFRRPHFWAWEAVAVWSEGLGDPPGAEAGRLRLERFRARFARGETTPIPALAALRQDELDGRHYDEIASFASWLLDADGGSRRRGFFRLLARVAAGTAETGDFERDVGLSLEGAERRWLASVRGR